MPTEFIAQNGLVFKQDTAIAVTGCTSVRHKAASRRRGSHRR